MIQAAEFCQPALSSTHARSKPPLPAAACNWSQVGNLPKARENCGHVTVPIGRPKMKPSTAIFKNRNSTRLQITGCYPSMH